MIGRALIFAHAALVQVASGEPPAGPFQTERVPDSMLAAQRGGLRLPGGIDVHLSIDTVTAVDGRIVLQTVTRIAEGSPVVSAYAPAEGQSVARPQRQKLATASQPQVTYDRQHGLTVTTGMPTVPVTLARGESVETAELASGLRALELNQAATTPDGVVQARGESGSGGIELQGLDIRILHLTGQAFGSAIVNSGSDRAIDTQTTLSIDLRNAGPEVLGSAMLRVEDVATSALAARF